MKSIKNIVSECFPKENWEMKDWKEDVKNMINRKDLDRDLFMETLVKAFDKNKIMKLRGRWHRGIGKTIFLIEVAEEYRVPLLVDTEWQVNLIKSSRKDIEVYSLRNVDFDEIKSKYILLDLLHCDDNKVLEIIKSSNLIPLGFISSTEFPKYELI